MLCYYLLFTHTLNLHISFIHAQSSSSDESSGSGDESDWEGSADGYAVRTPPPLSYVFPPNVHFTTSVYLKLTLNNTYIINLGPVASPRREQQRLVFLLSPT